MRFSGPVNRQIVKKLPKMAIFGLLRPKKGSKNYFFKFSYTTLLNNHPKMVSIENQPIWTKIEDLHTFFGKNRNQEFLNIRLYEK